MARLRGRHYIRETYGKFDVVSEHDDDEMVITGVPTRELAEELLDVINDWRKTH